MNYVTLKVRSNLQYYGIIVNLSYLFTDLSYSMVACLVIFFD